jgi:hypothetical protein
LASATAYRCVVLPLSLAATVLAGPLVGFMLFFSLLGGFGALFSHLGTWGEVEMQASASKAFSCC